MAFDRICLSEVVPVSMALAQGRFSRDQRIRKRSEYRSILNSGVRVSTPHCVFVVASRPFRVADGPPLARLGLVVSRKVGGAVLRNRFKRLAREVFRQQNGQLPEGVELVVIARNWSKDLGLSSLALEWAEARDRIFAALQRHRRKRKTVVPLGEAGDPC
jgi:ribonuclease P protein component